MKCGGNAGNSQTGVARDDILLVQSVICSVHTIPSPYQVRIASTAVRILKVQVIFDLCVVQTMGRRSASPLAEARLTMVGSVVDPPFPPSTGLAAVAY